MNDNTVNSAGKPFDLLAPPDFGLPVWTGNNKEKKRLDGGREVGFKFLHTDLFLKTNSSSQTINFRVDSNRDNNDTNYNWDSDKRADSHSTPMPDAYRIKPAEVRPNAGRPSYPPDADFDPRCTTEKWYDEKSVEDKKPKEKKPTGKKCDRDPTKNSPAIRVITCSFPWWSNFSTEYNKAEWQVT